MIVGTAGHVDHGKTSLVRALTGVDTDRLAEEKARGISIELGFAYARLDGDPSGEPIGFVDVPGHRKFVQTMIAGAAGIDVGLLVVAADDGPMPQTREHVDILRWLGVPTVVVALNKVDAVEPAQVAAAADAIRELLDGTPYHDPVIVPVSAASGRGIDALKSTLLVERDRVRPRDTGPRAFRLAIDRAFTLPGIGLVVTGTCIAGRVVVDDALTILPSRLDARVRSIRAHDQAVDEARAGQRVALALAGRGIEKQSVHRGDWIVASTIALETQRIDAMLSGDAAAFGSKDWHSMRIHHGATSVNARVSMLDAARGFAQVVFERPLHVLAADRFVLRDSGGNDGSAASVAGGVVLDVDVPTRGRRNDERLAYLAMAARGDERATLAHVVASSANGVDLVRWNRTHNTSFATGDIGARAVGQAGTDGGAVLFAEARWQAMGACVVDALDAEHARAPDAVGPARDRLRRMALPALTPAVFGALIDELKADGRVAQTGAWLHRPEHRVTLSADDRARFERARPLLAAEPNNPPRVRDVARSARRRRGRVAHDLRPARVDRRGLSRRARPLLPAVRDPGARTHRRRLREGRWRRAGGAVPRPDRRRTQGRDPDSRVLRSRRLHAPRRRRPPHRPAHVVRRLIARRTRLAAARGGRDLVPLRCRRGSRDRARSRKRHAPGGVAGLQIRTGVAMRSRVGSTPILFRPEALPGHPVERTGFGSGCRNDQRLESEAMTARRTMCAPYLPGTR